MDPLLIYRSVPCRSTCNASVVLPSKSSLTPWLLGPLVHISTFSTSHFPTQGSRPARRAASQVLAPDLTDRCKPRYAIFCQGPRNRADSVTESIKASGNNSWGLLRFKNPKMNLLPVLASAHARRLAKQALVRQVRYRPADTRQWRARRKCCARILGREIHSGTSAEKL